MSTTKRARSESQSTEVEPATRCVKKVKVTKEMHDTTLASLPDELQMEILIHVPFKELPRIRLVCSPWNKLTKLAIFGKNLCISTFGEDLAPNRIANLSCLSSAVDSELFLLPTTTQGSIIKVDWLKYYELRFQFKQHLHACERNAILFEISQRGHAHIPNVDSELSFLNFTTLLKGYNSSMCNSDHIVPLLSKLVPLLVHYQRFKTAGRAVRLLSEYKPEEGIEGMMDRSDLKNCLQLAKSFLDLVDLSRIHFPTCPYQERFYNLAMVHVKYICSAFAQGIRPKESIEEYRRVFRKALSTMIHEGAVTPYCNSRFKEYFWQPFFQCYRVLLDKYPEKEPTLDLHPEIISVCAYEFNKSTDWGVQASALAACHVSICKHPKYLADKVRFALSTLAAFDLHPEVRRAAFFTLYASLAVNFEVSGVTSDSSVFRQIMKRATEALLFLPKDEAHHALSALRVTIYFYKSEVFTDEMLDVMHDNMFELLLTPGVLKEMFVSGVQLVIDNIMTIAWVLRTRLKKYLPRYRSTLFSILTSSALRHETLIPEAWLATYIDIGCFISDDFASEAESIVAQVEYATLDIGYPIRKEQFFASCVHAEHFASCPRDEYIRAALTVFPDLVLDGYLDPMMYSESDSEDDYDSDDDDDEDEGALNVDPLLELLPTDPPEYVPYYRDQWEVAVESVRSSADGPSLEHFTFKPIAAEEKPPQGDIIPLNTTFYKRVTPWTLRDELDTPEIDRMTKMIMKWTDSEAGIKYAQTFLHIMNAYCMWGLIQEDHILCIIQLLRHLAPRLNDSHLTRYIGTAAKSLCSGKYMTDEPRQIIEMFVDAALKLLLPVPNVQPDLLKAILKLNRGLEEYGKVTDAVISRRIKVLDVIAKTWPRAAWAALQSSTLTSYRYFGVGPGLTCLHQLWQIRLYGVKGFAALWKMPARVFLSVIQKTEDLDSKVQDPIVAEMLPKMKLLIELCEIDSDIAELNFYNQFLFDQDKLKNALIKANKYPGKMKYYSELLF